MQIWAKVRFVCLVTLSLCVSAPLPASPRTRVDLRPKRVLRRQHLALTRGDPLALLPRELREKPVFGIMGSAADDATTLPPKVMGQLRRLGTLVGRRGALLTGACPGMPLEVAKAAKGAGGFVVGISPAGSPYDHVHLFKNPTRHLDVLQLANTGGGMGFVAREKLNVQNADIIFFAGGRAGTLGELAYAMQERKVIAILEDSTGVSAAAKEQILPYLGAGNAIIVSDANPDRLMRKALTAHRRLNKGASHQRPRTGATRRRQGATVAPVPQAIQKLLERKQRTPLEVFAIFGTDEGLDPKDRAKVAQLVSHIAAPHASQAERLLITPVERGLSTTVAHQAQSLRLPTLGIAAEGSAQELPPTTPIAAFDRIAFCAEGPGAGRLASYRHGIAPADVVFLAGGDAKTLGAGIFARYHPTVVGVLETKSGVTSQLRRRIFGTFTKASSATFVYDSDPTRLYQKALEAAEALRIHPTLPFMP